VYPFHFLRHVQVESSTLFCWRFDSASPQHVV
jgi:hypothetical protein